MYLLNHYIRLDDVYNRNVRLENIKKTIHINNTYFILQLNIGVSRFYAYQIGIKNVCGIDVQLSSACSMCYFFMVLLYNLYHCFLSSSLDTELRLVVFRDVKTDSLSIMI